MKRLLKKIVILTGLVICTILFLNFQYTETDFFQNKDGIGKFFHVPYELEMVNLGTSYGEFGFDYSVIPVKGFNLAMEAQHPYYDLSILIHFQSHLLPGAVVLIPISFYSLGLGTGEGDYVFQTRNHRYYRFLEPDQILDFHTWEFLKYKIFPVFFSNGNLARIIWDGVPEGKLYLGENQFLPSEMEKRGWERVESLLSLTDESHFEENAAIFREIVKLCKASGFQPVFIATPVTTWFFNALPPDILENSDQLIHSLSVELNVPYLDYSQDPDFYEEMDLFLDTDHLNLTGRKLFTQKVFHELEPLFDKH